jgi:hypothetical protein
VYLPVKLDGFLKKTPCDLNKQQEQSCPCCLWMEIEDAVLQKPFWLLMPGPAGYFP